MIAAGIEGGRKRAIEDDWGLDDVAEIRAYWRENGPPLNVSAIMIAKSLGMDLTQRPEEAPYGSIEPGSGPSIAELAAAITPPRPGGDTLAASREVLKLLSPEGRA